MQKADSAEVSWEPVKKRWEVRIHIGEEVVKRPLPGKLSEEEMRERVLAIAKDEGYELDRSHVAVDFSEDHPE